MSNLLFPMPSPPSGSWAWPVKKTPSFKTLVQNPTSNRGENRISLTPNPIYLFEYDFSYLKGDYQTLSSALANMVGFFNARGGAADDWLFQDPYDNRIVGQLIGYMDGVKTSAQLVRSLSGASAEIMQAALPTAIYMDGTPTPPGPQPSGLAWYCGIENLLLQSQDFEKSPWFTQVSGASAATIMADNNTAPDGNNTADQVSYPSTVGVGNYSDLRQTVAIAAAGSQVTFSVYLQASAGTIPIQIFVIDPVTGVSAQTSCSTTTTWTRFAVTITMPSITSGQLQVVIRSTNQGAVVIRQWGAQLERWPSATSYTTTTTAPVQPNGLVTFNQAPLVHVATADFNYYYRCRFLEDEWGDLEEFLYQIWENKSVKFKSLIL